MFAKILVIFLMTGSLQNVVMPTALNSFQNNRVIATKVKAPKETFSKMPDYQKPVPPKKLIVPGKSIGLTAIDQKEADVVKRLGKPNTGDASMGGHTEAIWYSKPIIHGADTVVNETTIYFYTDHFGEKNSTVKVDRISITSGYFETINHIKTGATLEAVQKYFPHLKQSGTDINEKTKAEITIYMDEKNGIGFEFEEGKCKRISVFKPY